jgi:hypothetical protein
MQSIFKDSCEVLAEYTATFPSLSFTSFFLLHFLIYGLGLLICYNSKLKYDSMDFF